METVYHNINIISSQIWCLGIFSPQCFQLAENTNEVCRCRDRFSSAVVPLRCDPQLFVLYEQPLFLCSDRVRQRERYLSLSHRSFNFEFLYRWDETKRPQRDHRSGRSYSVTGSERTAQALVTLSTRTYYNILYPT